MSGGTLDSGFLVVGGRQRDYKWRPEWTQYDRGIILHVAAGREFVRKVTEYVSPPDVRYGDDASVLLRGSTQVGERLYACSSTEVLVYSLPSFERIGYITHPYFNDLHHVTVNERGEVIIVNTGLDMVLVMSLDGKLIAEYSACDEPVWTRFSRDIDYRKVDTTKPHRSHPNFAFLVEGELFVTRCESQDAIWLRDTRVKFDIGLICPHDGAVADGKVYFTTVGGVICVFDATTRKLEERIDLNSISNRQKALGWCRGIEMLEPGVAIIGFTRLRRTKFHEKLLWIKERMQRELLLSESTRIAAYNLRTMELLWEVDLEQYEMNIISSIHHLRGW